MREGSPSATAVLVARSILLASHDPLLSRLSTEEQIAIYEHLLTQQPSGWFNFVRSNAWARGRVFAFERWILPGIIAHYLARKRCIERLVRGALDAGIRQVVIVGAGLDPLGWLLSTEFPAIQFFELDHPSTQALKRNSLEQTHNFHFSSVDLSDDSISGGLKQCDSFIDGVPTILVAEGLTMYLPVEQLRQLFNELSTTAGPDGRVVFTFMDKADDGSIGFRNENPLIARWLSWLKEPFKWGATRDELTKLLTLAGLRCDELIDHTKLRSEILQPLHLDELPLAEGEHVCLCVPLSQ